MTANINPGGDNPVDMIAGGDESKQTNDAELSLEDVFGESEDVDGGDESGIDPDKARGFDDFVSDEEKKFNSLAVALDQVVDSEEMGLYKSTQAYNKIAKVIDDYYSFVMPKKDTDGIRQCLHVYEPDKGIYQPHGKEFVKEILQLSVGGWVTRHKIEEICGHIRRANFITEKDLGGGETEIVVQNGIVDYATGDFRDHTPDDVFITRVEMPWKGIDREATAWREFFGEVVEEENVDTMFHIFAHCLVDAYPDEKAFLFVNDGGGGKSTTLELWEGALGEGQVSNEPLRKLASQSQEYSEAELFGKRANFGGEMSADRKSQLETFKELTGGDRISARFPYEGKFQFRNKASLVFPVNTIPIFDTDKDALWRRLVMIPFPNNFDSEEMADKRKSKDRLKEELLSGDALAGLLAASIRHTKFATKPWGEWFPEIDSMWDRRKQIKASSSPVFAFQNSCLTNDENGKVPIDEVHKCYREFVDQEGLSPGIEGRDNSSDARREFGKKLAAIKELKFDSKQARIDGSRERCYVGLSFTARGLQVLTGHRPGERILGSIEGQVHDDDGDGDEGDSDNSDESVEDSPEDVSAIVRGVIYKLEKENGDSAKFSDISVECWEHDVNPVQAQNAIDELESSGVIESTGDGYNVNESDDPRELSRDAVTALNALSEPMTAATLAGRISVSPEKSEELIDELALRGEIYETGDDKWVKA